MKEKSPAKHLSILFQICFMALKFSPWLLPSILFLNVFSSLVPASLIWIGKIVLDQLVYVVTNEASAEKLFFLVGLELFLRVFQSFLGEITTHLNLKFSSSFEHEIRRKFCTAGDWRLGIAAEIWLDARPAALLLLLLARDNT